MESLELIGQNAKAAARYVSRLSTHEKNNALNACADALENESDFLIYENKRDMEKADLSRTAAFADRLLLSCDVCLKTLLHRYGGWGYDHLLVNIRTMLYEEGVTPSDVETMLTGNPANYLDVKGEFI